MSRFNIGFLPRFNIGFLSAGINKLVTGTVPASRSQRRARVSASACLAALAEDQRGSVAGAAGYPGSGTVPDQVRYCQLPAGHDGQHEADLPEGFFTWQHRPASEVRRPPGTPWARRAQPRVINARPATGHPRWRDGVQTAGRRVPSVCEQPFGPMAPDKEDARARMALTPGRFITRLPGLGGCPGAGLGGGPGARLDRCRRSAAGARTHRLSRRARWLPATRAPGPPRPRQIATDSRPQPHRARVQ